MDDSRKSYKRAQELLFDAAAEAANAALGRALAQTEEAHVFSDVHARKMRKIFRQERGRLRVEKAKKYEKHAVGLLAILLILSAVVLCSVESWRTEFVREMRYIFRKEGSTSYTHERVTLRYVPAGYELQEIDETSDSLCLVFFAEKKYFQVDFQPAGVSSKIDTENGTMEDITINGLDAVYTTNPNINAVIWYDDEYSYRVLGTAEKEEIIKIAENLKKN